MNKTSKPVFRVKTNARFVVPGLGVDTITNPMTHVYKKILENFTVYPIMVSSHSPTIALYEDLTLQDFNYSIR